MKYKADTSYIMPLVLCVGGLLMIVMVLLAAFDVFGATPKGDVTIGKPAQVQKATPDAGVARNMRKELLDVLKDSNTRFREATGSKHDVKFQIFFSVDKPDKAAIVLNSVPGPDGKIIMVFGSFFYIDHNDDWRMLADTFDPME